jgi:hypothetical protein
MNRWMANAIEKLMLVSMMVIANRADFLDVQKRPAKVSLMCSSVQLQQRDHAVSMHFHRTLHTELLRLSTRVGHSVEGPGHFVWVMDLGCAMHDREEAQTSLHRRT